MKNVVPLNLVKIIADLWLMDDEHGWDSGGDGVVVKLFINNYTPTVDIADASVFTEAGFTGYTARSDVIAHTGKNAAGQWAIMAGEIEPWQCTNDDDPRQTVYGYWITSAVGGYILAAKRFDEPVVMYNGTMLMLDVEVTLPIDLAQRNTATPL